MNGQTISLEELYKELTVLETILQSLKTRVLSSLPSKYGSDAWWEESDKKGLEQIKRGEVVEFKTTKELKKHLGL